MFSADTRRVGRVIRYLERRKPRFLNKWYCFLWLPEQDGREEWLNAMPWQLPLLIFIKGRQGSSERGAEANMFKGNSILIEAVWVRSYQCFRLMRQTRCNLRNKRGISRTLWCLLDFPSCTQINSGLRKALHKASISNRHADTGTNPFAACHSAYLRDMKTSPSRRDRHFPCFSLSCISIVTRVNRFCTFASNVGLELFGNELDLSQVQKHKWV